MSPEFFYDFIVSPGLTHLEKVAGTVRSAEANVLVMAIAGQESRWRERLQIGGPARSFWQFEIGGGVAGVLAQAPSQMERLCDSLNIPKYQLTIFEAMAWNDTLACGMARLLLWSDPRPLPAVGQLEAAWEYYIKNWRPGLPHRETWDVVYSKSIQLVHN